MESEDRAGQNQKCSGKTSTLGKTLGGVGLALSHLKMVNTAAGAHLADWFSNFSSLVCVEHLSACHVDYNVHCLIPSILG